MRLIEHMRTYLANRDRWDDVCDRCGLCCFERVVYDDGTIEVDLTAPCEFLDEESRTCTVYEHRFRACRECHRVTPLIAVSKRFLPPSCAYRRLFGNNEADGERS